MFNKIIITVIDDEPDDPMDEGMIENLRAVLEGLLKDDHKLTATKIEFVTE